MYNPIGNKNINENYLNNPSRRNVMKKIMLLWLAGLAFIAGCSDAPTFAGKPDTPDETDKQILFHIHNADFAAADSLIEMRIKEKPDRPKYYFLKSSLLFHARYFYATPATRDSIKNLFGDYCRQTIRLAEKLPPTTENKFYLAPLTVTSAACIS